MSLFLDQTKSIDWRPFAERIVSGHQLPGARRIHVPMVTDVAVSKAIYALLHERPIIPHPSSEACSSCSYKAARPPFFQMLWAKLGTWVVLQLARFFGILGRELHSRNQVQVVQAQFGLSKFVEKMKLQTLAT